MSKTAATQKEQQFLTAATVLMLRDGDDGNLEVFMVKRHHKIDSFSGALVFPGGKVDRGDIDALEFCRDGQNLSDVAAGFRIAAIRESFEECGVMLAYEKGKPDLISAARVADLQKKYRKALVNGGVKFDEMCRIEGLELAADRMHRFAHWITPRTQPKVFDTQFYVVAAPPDQLALHDGEEATDSLWVRPADAVARADKGEFFVVFPTRMNLMKLSRQNNVKDALAAADAAKIVTVQPRSEISGDHRIMNIPKDAGYDGHRFEVRDGGLVITRLE